MNKRVILLAMALGAFVANAATTYVDVTATSKQTVQTPDVVLRPATKAVLDPSTLAAPAFWLDASATNGWTFSADGRVEALPSKVGSRRLVKGGPAGWAGWNDGVAIAPAYVTVDATTGLPCVDFGAMGSGCAMSFDGGVLANIGTVFMVRDTSNGGGWIFTGTVNAEYTWKRGNNVASADPSDPRAALAYAPADHVKEADELVRTAMMRQDGYPFIATSIGWGGKWEMFSFNPKEATLPASGLGINDIVTGEIARSGGFRIAEMIVYDRILTAEEVSGIENYLMQKWLGKLQPLTGADARINVLYANQSSAGGLTVGVDVGAERQMLVRGMRAGHDGSVDGKAKLVKTGVGSMRVGDFSRYDGTVTLQGGDIALDYVPQPEFPSEIAARAVYHFDPSVASTRTVVVENGTNFIMRLNDVDGHRRASDGKLFNLRSPVGERSAGRGDRRVYINPQYVSPTGLDTLDFGPGVNWGKFDARSMTFYADDTSTQPYKLTTIIAVVGVQRGGGWLANNGFQRRTQPTCSYTTGLMCEFLTDQKDDARYLCADPKLVPTNGVVFVDGERVPKPLTTGYPDLGFHIVAYQIPGSAPSVVGAYWDGVGGGLILGEMLAWTSPLSDKEVLETSEYLAKKWLGKSISDLHECETLPRQDGVADMPKLSVDGDASITVSGTSARLGSLTVNASLVKKGSGTLYVEGLEAKGSVAIAGGEIRSSARPLLDASGIAASPSFRLDLTDTAGWKTAAYGGKTVFGEATAKGTLGAVVKTDAASNAPWFDTTLSPVGRPTTAVLNFGTYGDTDSDPGFKGGKSLLFDRNLESVRSVFEVWRLPSGSGAFVLGSSGSWSGNGDGGSGTHLNAYRYDFHRGAGPGKCATGDASCTNGPFYSHINAAKALQNGTVYQNGVRVEDPTTKQPTYGEWVVVEAHAVAGVHVSAVGCDRWSMKRGGLALAELIVYERELTDREKISTRNYLMKKWLGKTDAELEPVPPADPAPQLHYETLEVLAEHPVEMGADVSSIEHLTGSGAFTKVGDSTMTLGFANAFTGALTVAEGALTLESAYRGAGEMARQGLRFRIAADELTAANLEANTDGTTGVKTWPSSVGDGWKAEAQERGYKIDSKGNKLSANIPVYEPASLNGKATVRMPRYTCFQFKNPAGEYASITNIRTALWVFGSQEGGGFLLGGGKLDAATGNEMYYAWHRGSKTTESAGGHKEDALVCGSGYVATYSADYAKWRVNGADLASPTAHDVLSGGWDVVSYYNVKSEPSLAASASGLAFDGRIFIGQNYSSRAGRQRLAELLLYTRKLSADEIAATEAYLNVKWGIRHTLGDPNHEVDLWVDKGATFTMDGYNAFRSVGGSGAVAGDFGAAGFTVAAGETGVQATGTVTIGENPVFTFKTLPDNVSKINVISAAAFEGLENLENATFVGLPPNWRAMAWVSDNRIVVRVGPRLGMTVIFW